MEIVYSLLISLFIVGAMVALVVIMLGKTIVIKIEHNYNMPPTPTPTNVPDPIDKKEMDEITAIAKKATNAYADALDEFYGIDREVKDNERKE